jgi:hypothetical protein
MIYNTVGYIYVFALDHTDVDYSHPHNSVEDQLQCTLIHNSLVLLVAQTLLLPLKSKNSLRKKDFKAPKSVSPAVKLQSKTVVAVVVALAAVAAMAVVNANCLTQPVRLVVFKLKSLFNPMVRVQFTAVTASVQPKHCLS